MPNPPRPSSGAQLTGGGEFLNSGRGVGIRRTSFFGTVVEYSVLIVGERGRV